MTFLLRGGEVLPILELRIAFELRRLSHHLLRGVPGVLAARCHVLYAGVMTNEPLVAFQAGRLFRSLVALVERQMGHPFQQFLTLFFFLSPFFEVESAALIQQPIQ